MTYFQYLLSDKKPAIYWIVILILVTLLSILNAFSAFDDHSYYSFWDYFRVFFHFIIFWIIYIGFYTSGYLTYKIQKKFLLFNKSRIEKDSFHEVLIYQDNFKLKAFRVNYDVTIMVPARKDYYQLCRIGDSLIILGHVYDFGLFKRHIRPIQINLNNSDNNKLKFARIPSNYDIEINNNNVEIKFKNSVSAINKLVIINYE